MPDAVGKQSVFELLSLPFPKIIVCEIPTCGLAHVTKSNHKYYQVGYGSVFEATSLFLKTVLNTLILSIPQDLSLKPCIISRHSLSYFRHHYHATIFFILYIYRNMLIIGTIDKRFCDSGLHDILCKVYSG